MLSGGTVTAFIASGAEGRDLADILSIDSVCQLLGIPDGRHEPVNGEENVDFSGSSLQLDEHKPVMGSERYPIHEILLPRLTKSLPHKRIPILSAVSRLDSARPNFSAFSDLTPMSKHFASRLAAA